MSKAGGLSPQGSQLSSTDRAIASLFGAGYAKFAPGTAGTAVAFAAFLLIPTGIWPYAMTAVLVLTTSLCVVLSRKLPEKGSGGDPSWFVLDEAAGLSVAVWATERPSLVTLLLAFVLFRIFDATKPPPIRRLEHVGFGLGIVLDDLLAGGYALGLVILARHWLPLD